MRELRLIEVTMVEGELTLSGRRLDLMGGVLCGLADGERVNEAASVATRRVWPL